jgi:hypothetical protein
MTTFNIDTAADDRELTAEELEIVAGGNIIVKVLEAAQKLAEATGGEAFFAHVNQLVRG